MVEFLVNDFVENRLAILRYINEENAIRFASQAVRVLSRLYNELLLMISKIQQTGRLSVGKSYILGAKTNYINR